MRIRRGITLLEVMFSMGVIAIGLLGVIAILPLALHQVGRGRVLDNATRVGQNAATEFRVRYMGAPTNWRVARTVAASRRSVAVSLDLRINQGYCIDPLFVSTQFDTNGATFDARLFPYFTRPAANSNAPRMNRISLAASSVTGMMQWAGAERVFVLQDELVFDIPEEKDAPPIQNFGKSGANRMYNGSTSWLATLSPNLDVTNQIHDAYVLSIVVFDNRDMTMPMDADTERLISVDWLTSTPQPFSGLGGGDLILDSASLDDLIGIQSGKWIMLMGNTPTNVKPMPQFRWYRVVATDSEPVANATATRFRLNATVQGPDWDTRMATEAVFMPGVVAVYDRSIRLETSSLWTN